MIRIYRILLAFLVLLLPLTVSAQVSVQISGPGGVQTQNFPDAGGQFDFNVPLTSNALNSFKITAKDGNGNTVTKDVSVTQLSLQSLAVASLKVEPLSPERVRQLVQDGVIKLDDPDNFNVSAFTIVLTIGTIPTPIVIPVAVPKAVQEVTGQEEPPPVIDPGGGNGNSSDTQIIVFEVHPPGIPGLPPPPNLPGVIVIDGRIKTLKEFFSAKFLLMNTSGLFTLKDVVAKLSFPDGGLSYTLPADGIAGLGDILPGSGSTPGQALKEFIFRGDEKGLRHVKVDFGGSVGGAGIPEGQEIPFNGAAVANVEVKGPPSFKVRINHPDFVTSGVPYQLDVELLNDGDSPALYTSLDLDIGADAELVDCTILPSGDPSCLQTPGPVTRKFGDIFPGQSGRTSFTVLPHVTGPVTSCMGISDQNINLEVTVGNLGCITGKFSPPNGVPDGIPVVSVLPFSNAVGIGIESPVVALFTERMQEGLITTERFKVFKPDGEEIPGKIRFTTLNNRTIAIWQVNDGILNKLEPNLQYSVEVSKSIKDLQGNDLFAAWTSKFTTTGEGYNDFTPPTLSLSVEPPVNPNNVYPGQVVRVNAYAQDQGTAVKRVELRIQDLTANDGVKKLLDQRNVETGDKPPFFFTLDSKSLIPGHTYQLLGTAYDFADNSQDSTLSMQVSATAPTPTVDLPNSIANTLKGLAFGVTPTSYTGGVYQVQYAIDGAPLNPIVLPPYSVNVPTLNLSVGTHTLSAVVVDGLNQSGSDSVQFEVLQNDVVPTITWVTPDEGTKFVTGTNLPLAITVTDPVGVQEIKWYFQTVASNPIAVNTTGFSINTSQLPLGSYKIIVVAKNKNGLSTNSAASDSFRNFEVIDPPPAPPPPPPSSLNVSLPENGKVNFSGTTTPGRRVDIVNVQLGLTVTVYANASGNFSGSIDGESGQQLQFGAFDESQKNKGTTANFVIAAPAALVSLSVTPSPNNFTSFNATQNLTVIAHYADASVANITSQATYTTSAPSVAGVSSNGNIVSLGNGNAAITASFGGLSASAAVYVNVRVLQSLSILPPSVSFSGIGQTQQLTVTGNFSDNTTENLTGSASFVTGNPNIALVNGGGLISAISGGTTSISVSRPGLAAVSVPVEVSLSDGINPTVSIDSPAIGASFERGQAISFQVSGNDSGSGVRNFIISSSGGFTYSETKTVAPAVNATQTFTIFVPANVTLPGTVTLSAVIEDAAGNQSAAASRSFNLLDKTAPTVSIVSPAPGTPYNSGDTITLQVNASDSVGVTQIRYTGEGSFSDSGSQAFGGTAGAQSATFNITVPFGVVNPEFIIKGFAKDAAGNESQTTPLTVNITSADITPPVTQATAISSPSGANATITYTVTDGLSDLDHVELFFRRNGIGTFNRYTNADAGNTQGKFNPSGNTGTIVFNSTKMGGDGGYEFYTVGVDTAGNREPAPTSGSAVTPDKTATFAAGTVVTTISSNTSVAAGDTSFDNKNLKITGNITVTLDGSHSFNNVELLNGAKLVHSATTTTQEFGLDITVWSLSIDSTSSIDVTGRGYLGGEIAGNGVEGRTLGNVPGATSGSGGSYGGPGGVFDGATNALYGNLTDPFDLGSGGGSRSGWDGGNGGGKVRVSAINIAADGNIAANGNGGQGNASGDGSGGAVNFAVASLSGNGLVTANGGASQSGGGGGRIGVTYIDISTKDKTKIRALGGLGGNRAGGNGTVFLRDLSQSNGDLVFDGQPGVNTFTVLPIPNGFVFDNITLRNNARVIIDLPLTVANTFKVESSSIVSHSTASEAGLKITAKNIVVDSTSAIDVDGRGYLGGCVGGNAGNNALGDTLNFADGGTSGAGGSYGGEGGLFDGIRNPVYGDPKDPKFLGSGGGCRSAWFGGNGGGLIDLIASDTVDVDGAIRSTGSGGQGNASGDGSGGTIRISTVVLKGQGTITANGGASQSGGSGGRIHIKYTFIPTGADGLNDKLNILARGGRGGNRTGSAGTVVLKRNDQTDGDLYIDDDQASTAPAETELTPIGFGRVQAVTSNTLTLDGTYPELAGGLVGLNIRPNVNSNQTYKITANTANQVTVDTTAKPSLTSLTAAGATYAGSYSFDNVYTRRGGSLRLSDKLNVAGTISISEFGRLTHRETYVIPPTFTKVTPRLEVIAQNFIVSANSSIDVSGRGYPGGESDDATETFPNGFTAGFVDGATSGQAGSHGGLGASYNVPIIPPSALFDSVTDPIDYGAGGASRGSWDGGDGGGVVMIQTANLQIDGTIAADGLGGQGNASGDGAGGTINIRTSTITGAGTIHANGGASQAGGGGGRIAIRYGNTLGITASQLLVNGGQGGNATGGNGTLFLKGQNQVNGDLRIEGRNNFPGDLAVMPVGVTFDNIVVTNNARVLVNSVINATQSVQLTNNSSMTHTVGDESGVQINAPSMLIDSTSSIDVSSRGYRGGELSGNPSSEGETLGKQLLGKGAAPGSYGGVGYPYDAIPASQVYGSPFEPIYLGAGGGARSGWDGGNGGGRVQLNITGTLNVQGAIRANGGGGQGNASGDGAGGSVMIQAGTFQGTGGLISANGGASQAGGGGGRIYIKYNSIVPTDFSNLRTISAFGGRGGNRAGSPGTIVLRSSAQAYGDLIIDDNIAVGVPSSAETYLTPLGVGTISSITGGTFTIDGGVELVPGGLVGLTVKPNANNAATFLITGNDETTVTVDTSSLALSSVASVGDKYAISYTFNNLVVRGLSSLDFYDPINVLGATSVTEGSRISHRDVNSTLYTPRLDLTTNSLTLAADSSFNVDGRGYPGGQHPGAGGNAGLTLGFTPGSTGGGGGGYGGLGGQFSTNTRNPVYGNANNPFELGSGGGSRSGWDGGDGGGAIRIVAGTAVINGPISAIGGGAQGNAAGDGSGGSINLTVGNLSGTGTISANGGASQTGGGGGRVFISASTNTLPAASVNAAGGAGGNATGQNGTVVIQ